MKLARLMVCCAAACALGAQEIVALESLGGVGSAAESAGGQSLAMGWSTASAASQVNIWVNLFTANSPGTGTGTAYLMRNIGPTATSEDQVAVQRVTAPNNSTWVRLFSNLDLPAGRYYVVLRADANRFQWRQANLGSERLSAGTTLLGSSFSRTTPAFAPAAVFTAQPLFHLSLVVTSDPDFFVPFNLIAGSLPRALLGANYSAAITHTRPTSTGSYAWSTQGDFPAWLTLRGDATTGALRLEGQVPLDARSSYAFSIQLTDRTRNRSSTLNTGVNVVNQLLPPSLGGFFRLGEGITGSPYVESVQPIGGTPPYTYSFTGSLPPGLRVNESTGLISGTPTQAGEFRAAIVIRDSANANIAADVTFNIRPSAPVNLTHVNSGSPTVLVLTTGEEVNQTLTIAPGATAIATHQSTLPAGLSLAPNGRLTGRPSTAANQSFCLRGETSDGAATRCFWAYVLPARTLRFATWPAAIVGTRYTQALSAASTGGIGSPGGNYFYQLLDPQDRPIDGNVVAPGLTLTARGGLLSGTPTQAGSFPIRVRMTDYSSYWVGGTSAIFNAPSPLVVSAADITQPLISGVTHGASFATGAIAPGEIITLFGANLGPAELRTLALESGRVSTTLAGTQVTINNTPAPVIYTSATQVSVVVPYALSGNTASIVATYNGRTTAAFTTAVTAAAPALFTLDGSGRGLPAALNQDGSIHSLENPATPGSVMVLYGTGEGQTDPPGTDGALATSSTLPRPMLPVTVTIGGRTAEVLYAGAAPGLVAGVFQINVRIPADTTPGDAVPLVVQVGTARSPNGINIAVPRL